MSSLPAAPARHRILFVAENVTVAQVVRLVKLAQALPTDRYEVHFASAGFPEFIFAGLPFVLHEITTLPTARATAALESGKRMYEQRQLQRYVEAELKLFLEVQPALVVGDFRWSLSTSAELFRVPCGVLINAYWSPFRQNESFPVPDHPIFRLVGEARAAQYFAKAMPYVFKHFAAPLNAVRARYGLAPVGSLLELLCHGDYTLYPDEPTLTPVHGAPTSHRFLGPVLWEPNVPAPVLSFPEPARPLVYVTLGSSGQLNLMPAVIQALASLPVNALVATAGRLALADLPSNIIAKPFVPGSEVARRARVVVSNGGSTTGYQALSEGTPVVGIPSNFDQYLATQAIVAAGAGIEVKARHANATTLQSAIGRALCDEALGRGAELVAKQFATYDSGARFQAWVAEVVGQIKTQSSEA
jgi:UDP:flavonoid glycosyltransferase YjiC (YdhE family)